MGLSRYAKDAVKLALRKISPSSSQEKWGHIGAIPKDAPVTEEVISKCLEETQEQARRFSLAGMDQFCKSKVGAEFGAGPYLGLPAWLINLGASKIFATDIKDSRNPKLIREVFKRYSSDESRLEFVPGVYAENCNSLKENSFDFLYSSAVLEHCMAVPKAADEEWKVLNGGGRIYHLIAIADHRYSPGAPLEFLTFKGYEQSIIEKGAKILGGYPENRIRPSQFVSIFQNRGFKDLKTLYFEPISEDYIKKTMPKISKKFQDLPAEDYSYRSCLIYGRKP